MSDLWYCVCTLLNPLHLIIYIRFPNGRFLTSSFSIQEWCGYGPHNPAIHVACIMCGRRYDLSFSTESSDVRATDFLNPSKVRPRELKDELNELQNDFSDDSSEGSSVSASQFNVPLSRHRPLSSQCDQLPNTVIELSLNCIKYNGIA